MRQLIQNRWVSWIVRCILFCPFVLWGILFVLGWVNTRPESRPIIEGKSLYAWDGDLSDGGLVESANSPERNRATAVIRQHCQEIIPTVLEWAQRRESLPAEVYFNTLQLILGKRSSYTYGVAAHEYRGAAARILGALGPIDPRVLPTLNEIHDNPRNLDYEREVAQQSLNRIADAVPRFQ
jgi:hypothetical protein